MFADEAYLSSTEKSDLIELLTKSKEQTSMLIASLSDEGWHYRIGPERWSVGLIMEHLAFAEVFLFKNAEDTLAGTANPKWMEETRGKTEFLWRVVPNRFQNVSSPEVAIPLGEVARAEAIDRFGSARAKTIDFVETTDLALKAFTSEHFFWGTVNAYHWLLHLVLHNVRHNQQMLEIMANRDYPH